MKTKIGMVSLGCSKNQVDGEMLLGNLALHGYDITGDVDEAEIVIVNTCGFIEAAKEEAIENILEFCSLKGQGNLRYVLVTGCLAERYKEEILLEIPEVDGVIGIGKNGEISELIERLLGGERLVEFGKKEDMPLSGYRLLTTPEHYSYLKVADGCDNCCSYCAIPMIRGKYRSRPMEDLVKEAEYLASKGTKELMVVAQDTTRYGEDLYGEYKLPELLRLLNKIEGFQWIRILYAYPDKITDELLDTMAELDKVLPYLDIPFQHINEEILSRMNRSGNYKETMGLLSRIRKKLPDVTIRSTFIAGFPGETEEQHEELLRFIGEAKLDRSGCFAYSPEEGTPAAKFLDQIPEEIRVHRAFKVMEAQQLVTAKIQDKKVGDIVDVMVDEFDDETGLFVARTAGDAIEIDCLCFIEYNDTIEIGSIITVAVTGCDGLDLFAQVM